MRRTLDSVLAGTLRPARWVIVDDGSTDDTPRIAAAYADKYPDIVHVVTRKDRGVRKLGGGVIEAFEAGYATIDSADFDYVCKLDLDLDLPPAYFERCVELLESDRRLATVSGKPYMELDGKLVPEVCGDENSVGMVKLYRTDAFEQIGRFVQELMWDGIDCHRCRMLGWRAASVDEPDIRFTHLRPMGTSHKNWWTGRVRHGWGQYFMGTGPAYLLASAAFRLRKPPVLLGSMAMVWGYVKAWWNGVARFGDADGSGREFRQFLRRYQRACLTKGKTRATLELDQQQAKAWNQSTAA